MYCVLGRRNAFLCGLFIRTAKRHAPRHGMRNHSLFSCEKSIYAFTTKMSETTSSFSVNDSAQKDDEKKNVPVNPPTVALFTFGVSNNQQQQQQSLTSFVGCGDMSANPSFTTNLEDVYSRLTILQENTPQHPVTATDATSPIDHAASHSADDFSLLTRLVELAAKDGEFRKHFDSIIDEFHNTIEGDPDNGYPAIKEESNEEEDDHDEEDDDDDEYSDSETDIDDKLTECSIIEEYLGDEVDYHSDRECFRTAYRNGTLSSEQLLIIEAANYDEGYHKYFSDEDYVANELPLERDDDKATLTELLEESVMTLKELKKANGDPEDVELDLLVPTIDEELDVQIIRERLDHVQSAIEEHEVESEEFDVAVNKLSNTIDILSEMTNGGDSEIKNANVLLDTVEGEDRVEMLDDVVAMTETLQARIDELVNKDPSRKRKRDDLEAYNEIYLEQRSTDLIIDSKAFRLLVAEITQDYRRDTSYTDDAMDALQTATEDYLIDLFRQAGKAAIHGNRTYVMPQDIQFIIELHEGK